MICFHLYIAIDFKIVIKQIMKKNQEMLFLQGELKKSIASIQLEMDELRKFIKHSSLINSYLEIKVTSLKKANQQLTSIKESNYVKQLKVIIQVNKLQLVQSHQKDQQAIFFRRNAQSALRKIDLGPYCLIKAFMAPPLLLRPLIKIIMCLQTNGQIIKVSQQNWNQQMYLLKKPSQLENELTSLDFSSVSDETLNKIQIMREEAGQDFTYEQIYEISQPAAYLFQWQSNITKYISYLKKGVTHIQAKLEKFSSLEFDKLISSIIEKFPKLQSLQIKLKYSLDLIQSI